MLTPSEDLRTHLLTAELATDVTRHNVPAVGNIWTALYINTA